jgi:hypothetical protein
MKRNFASHRLFRDVSSWNQSFLDWLKRTGNYNPHGTTKKVPAQVFLEEQKYLKPVPTINIIEEIVTRTVRKDNTVLYRGNRYSVPLGTYRPGMALKVRCPLLYRQQKHKDSLINLRISWYFTKMHDCCYNTPPV